MTTTSTLIQQVLIKSLIHAIVLSLLLFSFSQAQAQEIDGGSSSVPPAIEPATEGASPSAEMPTGLLDGNNFFLPESEVRKTDLMYDRPAPDESRREELLVLYQQQTEDYKEKERQFRISRAQWESLNTLAALEDMVTKTREVLIARDKVAITYAELVLDGLQRSTGIEITQKEKSNLELTSHVEWLRSHLMASEQAISRELVNARSDEFSDFSLQYQVDTQRALALLAVGKVQTVVDKADALFVRIQKYYQEFPGGVTEQVARNREFEQVRLHREELSKELYTIRQTLENRDGRNSTTMQSVVTALDKSYTATSQYLSYLYELTN